MLKLIKIMRKRDELRNALADAIRADDEDRVSVAMDDWMQFVTDTVTAEADGVIEESDRSVLAARGVRQLTAEETKFYENIIAAARQDAQTVITGITSALPQTVIDSVLDDMRKAYPLLDMIDFVNTGAAIKWNLNSQAAQAATWDELNTEITKDLAGALAAVDLTQRKLSAYMCIAQDMLEHGPAWVDRYVRAILADALATGLETGIIDGNGLKLPIGMTRDFTGSLDSETGYARKSATTVTTLDPTTYGGLLASIAVDGNTGKTRPISRALLLVNPADYLDKLAPAVAAQGQASDYVGGVLPFRTDIVQSVGVPTGKAVLGIAKKYFLGVGTGEGGKLENSDEHKFADDLRTYKIKFYGTGRPYDINAFLYLDISNLAPVIPQIVMDNPPIPETTITGIPPISFKSDGTPLNAWSISGAMTQTGTPTSDTPIMPEFVGVGTGNLFDPSTATLGKYINAQGIETASSSQSSAERLNHSDFFAVDPNGSYTLSSVKSSSVQQTVAFCWYDAAKTFLSRTTEQKAVGTTDYSITGIAPSDARFAIINYTTANNEVMLNLGSTALPYEPFGCKTPITCAGQTVPIYLGQTQTTRRIKKLVLTGEEAWGISNSRFYLASLTPDYLRGANQILAMCSHYVSSPQVASAMNVPAGCISFSYASAQRLYCYDTSIATVPAFKQYLASEYEAGHPVTVWYVLATPETGIVNEPLAKIGGYADELHSTDAGVTIPTVKGQNTLSIGTTLQPSEVSITGHIKQA